MKRVEVALKEEPNLFDAQGHIDRQRILDSLGIDVDVEYRKVFTEDLELNDEEFEKFSKELCHPITHNALIEKEDKIGLSWGDHHPYHEYIIEVGYKPGVMDPEGRSAKLLAESVLSKKFPFERKVAVQHQRSITSRDELSDTQLKKIAGLFANDTVQSSEIWKRSSIVPRGKYASSIVPYMPSVKVPPAEPVKHYDLNLPDNELLKISNERCLSLDLEEILAIKRHYNQPWTNLGRQSVGLSEKATDVELELIAQTWSEHCKHKIFNAEVNYIGGERKNWRGKPLEERIHEGIFKKYIKNPTLKIQRQKKDFIKSVLSDNAGVVEMDPDSEHYVCFKCETHNSPSFIEPYGGAITGIVGVYRDPMGTGRGSQLTFGVWGYGLGSIFYDGKLRPPLHPDQLLEGIHRGVRDGGNKHGVPTAIGGTFFDESYLGKCLVYVGAAGLIPKSFGLGPEGYEKWIDEGDRCIVVGGRVGKDGIHGATASSKEYSESTPAGHVQIGDPYTQKNVQEFILDALDEGLINFSQDSGAGGIGSAAGEMAQHSGGAVIDLDKDLFKYEGLAPWEIIESESQERMFLAVAPDNLERIVSLAKKWGVEWRDIGEFNDSGYFHVRHKGETVAYLDLDFLHEGVPQKKLKAVWQSPEKRGLKEPCPEKKFVEKHNETLYEMLKRENIASKEFLQREYDTRVQGRTVIPAFIGKKSDVPSEAFVQKIEFNLESGVACGIGLNPSYSKIDTYHMTQLAANEGLMRTVAVGGDPDLAANNGNYCWPGVLPDEAENKEDAEYKTAQLVRAAKAQHDFALATGVATISGKDSMKIQGSIPDTEGNRHKVYGLPAIQFATIAQVPDVRKCVTSDFKRAGDIVYYVGLPTNDELGASEFYEHIGEVGLNVPKVNLKESMNVYRALHTAINKEAIESAKICSKGGLGVALALASFAGGLGAYIDLNQIPTTIKDQNNLETKLMYSESASRFIVSVAPENMNRFESCMGKYAKQIGKVTGDYLEIRGMTGEYILQEDNQKLKESWQSTFKHKMYAQEK